MKNWKTTTLGVLGIVSVTSTAAYNFFSTGTMPDWGHLATALAVSIGLLFSKDYNVSGTGSVAKVGNNLPPNPPVSK